jgi:hypothetical protein
MSLYEVVAVTEKNLDNIGTAVQQIPENIHADWLFIVGYHTLNPIVGREASGFWNYVCVKLEQYIISFLSVREPRSWFQELECGGFPRVDLAFFSLYVKLGYK